MHKRKAGSSTSSYLVKWGKLSELASYKHVLASVLQNHNSGYPCPLQLTIQTTPVPYFVNGLRVGLSKLCSKTLLLCYALMLTTI